MADKNNLDDILSVVDENDFYRLIVQLTSEAAYIGNDILAHLEGSKFASGRTLEKRKYRMKQILTSLMVLCIGHKDYGHDVNMASDFLAEIYSVAKMPKTGNSGLDSLLLGIMKSLGRSVGKEIMKDDEKKPSKDDANVFMKDGKGWVNLGKAKDVPNFKEADLNDFWTQMMQNLQTDKYDDSSYSAYHEPKKTEENYKATWHNEDLKGDQNDESDSDKSGN